MKVFKSDYQKKHFKNIWLALSIKIMLCYLMFRFKQNSMEKNINIQHASFLSFLKKPGLKDKKIHH